MRKMCDRTMPFARPTPPWRLFSCRTSSCHFRMVKTVVTPNGLFTGQNCAAAGTLWGGRGSANQELSQGRLSLRERTQLSRSERRHLLIRRSQAVRRDRLADFGIQYSTYGADSPGRTGGLKPTLRDVVAAGNPQVFMRPEVTTILPNRFGLRSAARGDSCRQFRKFWLLRQVVQPLAGPALRTLPPASAAEAGKHFPD